MEIRHSAGIAHIATSAAKKNQIYIKIAECYDIIFYIG